MVNVCYSCNGFGLMVLALGKINVVKLGGVLATSHAHTPLFVYLNKIVQRQRLGTSGAKPGCAPLILCSLGIGPTRIVTHKN